MNLVYYNPLLVIHPSHNHLPGMEKFSAYFKIYNKAVVPVDRTGTITFPIRMKSLFPMPAYRAMNESYADICAERAAELLARADAHGLPLHVFWSGGIDSTGVLVSFLKVATPTQRSNMTVLMSEESITENPNFYRDHIYGKLRRESANQFPYLLGGKFLFVNGEHNDQLFGSDIVAAVIQRFGTEAVHTPYDRTLFTTFFAERIGDEPTALFYVDLFERLKAAAPVEIKTNYDLFWWINFSCKWQTVYARTLSYTAARNAPLVTADYIRDNYAPFYNTEKFQLWSMNNPDKKIKDEWRTYKWAAKEYIYDFTKDADYRDNKLKRGSLYNLTIQRAPLNFIDESFAFHESISSAEYINPENDFV